ncbi:MAG: hypothetical protein QGG25_02140, partial [Phycisphaerae bacterium]|nr:hypothetical protein [Phycisphaerae bacterium]
SDPFALDSFGRTSLFHAAETGDIETVKEIIFSLAGMGVSCQRLSLINIKDKFGATAADAAEKTGHKEISSLLRGEAGRMEYFE